MYGAKVSQVRHFHLLQVFVLLFCTPFVRAEITLWVPVQEKKRKMDVDSNVRPFETENSTPLAQSSLEKMPSVFFQHKGNTGGLSTASFRGLPSTHTLLLVDGVPVNSPALGSADFSRYLSGSFAHIRSYAQASPVLYGPGASGGVINFETDSHTRQVKAEGGSFGRLYGYGGYRVRWGAHHTSMHVESLSTKGLPQYGKIRQLGEKCPYHNQTIAAVHTAKKNDLKVKMTARQIEDNLVYDVGAANTESPLGKQRAKQQMATFSLAQRFENFIGKVQPYVGRTASAYPSSQNVWTIQGIKATGTLENTWGESLFLFSRQTSQLKQDGFVKGRVDQAVGVRQKIVWGKNFVHLGVRKDWFSGIKGIESYEGGIARHTDLGILRAALCLTGRPPMLYDLYYENDFVRANPELRQEKVKTLSFSYEKKLGSQTNFRFSPYWTKLDKPIFSKMDEQGKWVSVNSDTVTIQGIEILLEQDITQSFAMRLTYASNRKKSHASYTAAFPRHKGALEGVFWADSHWELRSSLSLMGAYQQANFSVKPWHVWDFQATYHLTENHRLYGRLQNILNEHQLGAWHYRRPGFSVQGGAQFFF